MAANRLGGTVLIPAGRNYTIVPHAPLEGLKGVTFALEGTLIASNKNLTGWPLLPRNTTVDNAGIAVLHLINCQDVTITGGGMIDGQGYNWWFAVLFEKLPDHRPKLIEGLALSDIRIDNIRLINSPYYHVFLFDALRVRVTGVTVYVDVFAQTAMLRQWQTANPADVDALLMDGDAAALTSASESIVAAAVARGASADEVERVRRLVDDRFSLPLFPLNTDGIDVAGRDVVVSNCTIENFDDAVCVKPLNGANSPVAGPCSSDWLVENTEVKFGVGLTIGSVGPSTSTSCIRNITFRDAVMREPIKGIYIKPNPGTHGNGIIDAITYENVHMDFAIWWSIYVGTQQQDQPNGGADTGCSFFFPLPGTKCPLQPRVPVTNLILRNVTSVNALLSPGLLRCADQPPSSPTPAARSLRSAAVGEYAVDAWQWSPCDGWVFDNVHMSSITNWPVGSGYYCEGIVRPNVTNSFPTLSPCDS